MDAVRLFLRMQTQWEIETVSVGRTALIIHTGLRYTSLPVIADALGIAVTSAVLDQLGVMERESLRIHDVRLQRARTAP